MRKLSAEERELWAKVAETIEPLSRDPADQVAPTLSKRPKPILRRPPTPERPVHIAPPSRSHFDATLDGGWDRRLKSGKVSPDRVIDLHGHRLDDAWNAIDRGLEQAIAAGDRLVLLITGHPPKGEPPVARGKIRDAVEGWLSASRHSSAIAAVRKAHQRHGGRGALYLVLRRSRSL
ncbi:Smr/MutS family protein [Sphingomicrobium clamense]|uniref:Smr/MutS family protein n=1 Tax=Sphingomicrobium clamense TaxID=2851013 RepID=UPI0031F31D59